MTDGVEKEIGEQKKIEKVEKDYDDIDDNNTTKLSKKTTRDNEIVEMKIGKTKKKKCHVTLKESWYNRKTQKNQEGLPHWNDEND